MVKAAALALICFLIFLAIHFLIFHFLKPKEKFRSIMRSFSAFGILYMLLYFISPSELLWESWIPVPAEPVRFALGSFFYLFLLMWYLEFYFTCDRSITCRMLIQIEASRSKSLTQQEMIHIYQPHQLIQHRFDDMEYGGYLTRNGNGAYQLTPKGRKIRKIYHWMRDILNMENGE